MYSSAARFDTEGWRMLGRASFRFSAQSYFARYTAHNTYFFFSFLPFRPVQEQKRASWINFANLVKLAHCYRFRFHAQHRIKTRHLIHVDKGNMTFCTCVVNIWITTVGVQIVMKRRQPSMPLTQNFHPATLPSRSSKGDIGGNP